MRESDYYIWLTSLVYRRNYTLLLKQLDNLPFRWLLRLDENRSAGGINLRSKYAYETSTNEEDVRDGECTVLEMLVGVANHMEDQIGCDISSCFWILIENLRLSNMTDDNYDPYCVERTIDIWLSRGYDRHGNGSIFPLRAYPGDCRNLDIWSQMNAWINENYPTDNCWN